MSSCSGVGFDLVVPVDEQVVQGNPVGGVLGGLLNVPIPLTVDVGAETAARGTGPAKAIRLSELYLDITTTEEPLGDMDDFDFLDSVQIYVESVSGTSSLPRVLVAEIPVVPSGVRHIDFTVVPEVDLLPYVNEGARLTASATGNVPMDSVSFDGAVVLTVEVL